ncbi:MAG: hypothetical protein JRI70_06835 [Deltaproteobacteria bacterium]|nr:hypothetical protein [Deltaproteobacteria bacterium]
MSSYARTSIFQHVTVHDDRACTPDVDSMGMSRDVVILHGQILDREPINNRLSANTRVEINHAVM